MLYFNYEVHTKKKYPTSWLVQMANVCHKIERTHYIFEQLDNPHLYPNYKALHSYQWYERYYDRLEKLQDALVEHTGLKIGCRYLWEANEFNNWGGLQMDFSVIKEIDWCDIPEPTKEDIDMEKMIQEFEKEL
jgi:hypothetical protein